MIGSKGIGKLAGFGIASRMRVTSWNNGQQSSITIDHTVLESVQTLSDYKFDILVAETEHANGTQLELLDLHEGLHLPAAEVIRRHLYTNLPPRTDFVMKVNDVECKAQDILGKKSVFSENIEDVGSVTGYYIVANARQSMPGLAIRVRGRIVQEPSLFGLDTRAHGFFTAEKIAGEINAEFLDPEDHEGKLHDLIKTSRDGFLEDSSAVQHFNEWASTYLHKSE